MLCAITLQEIMSQDFWIIGLAFKIIAGLFAFLAALFTFLAVLENEKHESTKIWFSKRWKELSNNSWTQMPEKLIAIFVRSEKSLSKSMEEFLRGKIGSLVIVFVPFLAYNIGVLLFFNYQILFLSFASSIPFIVWAGQNVEQRFKWYDRLDQLLNKLPQWLNIILIIVPNFGGAVIWIAFSLGSNLFLSLASTVIALPCFVFLILAPISIIDEMLGKNFRFNESSYIFIGTAVGLSFTITFLSFVVGNLVSINSYIPQTFQMLISNVIFDGLTLLVTFKILEWSLSKNSWIRIPLAITFDIIVAAFLACISLYVGLLYSKNELLIGEVLLILIGKAKSGYGFELGPLFWAMHTTFIPTFIYLLFITVGFLGKSLITPIKWFFGKGQEHKNPFALTAALFTILATILTLSGLAIDGIEKRADKNQQKTEMIENINNH